MKERSDTKHCNTKNVTTYVPHQNQLEKKAQNDHTSNFHDYVIISVHLCLFFVSVAQLFAKLILSAAQFLYHKVF